MSERRKAAFEMIPGNLALRRLQWYRFGELQRFEKDLAPWNLTRAAVPVCLSQASLTCR